MSDLAPTCPFCGRPLEPRACYGFLHHHRCPSCPAAACYQISAGVVSPVRCRGELDTPKGARCEACGGTGLKPAAVPAPKAGKG